MLEPDSSQRLSTGVLVIGSGIAGLRAAIAARQCKAEVVLLSESPAGFRSNSAISRAVFAAAGFRPDVEDSPEAHLEDIISGGRLLSDRRLVAAMTQAVSRQVDVLQEYGVNFERIENKLRVGRAPGHSLPRHLSVIKNQGINITRPMRHYAAGIGVRFIEGVQVTRLLRDGNQIAGALGLDMDGRVYVIAAGATVLATGGAGRIYRRTNNAAGSTGDGYALAYDVGAVLRDMEFVQFYPTGWGKDGRKMCFYEGLLPIGATIRNSRSEDIMVRHDLGDYTAVTRDKLARTIMKEIAAGCGIDDNLVFDFSTVPDDKSQLLQAVKQMSHATGLDSVPVSPTVHFMMGGIKTDESTGVGIDGLYAAGEVCGGIHGANRLGGNAISETLVFGEIAGNQAAAFAGKRSVTVPESDAVTGINNLKRLVPGSRTGSIEQLWPLLKKVMWERAGVIRDEAGLEAALGEITLLREQLELTSIPDSTGLYQAAKLTKALTVAEMICRAAVMRTESRGAHYRSDHPEEDTQHWLKNIEISRHDDKMTLAAVPVSV